MADTPRPKQIRVNGFAIHAPVHLSPGLWTHPRDRSLAFNTLDYWLDTARLLERGLFDSIFIADGIGMHDVYAASPDATIRGAVQFPKYDPMMLVSAMASVTEHLGFGITSSVSYEPPFTLARRFSTLDHLTRGRIAWNVVTGYSNAASRAVGRPAINAHDARYGIADEFMEAVYKLWEGSWEDDAVLRDTGARTFADPAKVHRVTHRGEHFQLDAIHLVDPSPQRTPFLFQAGSSNRGRDFAAAHAEAVFVSDASKASVRDTVADIRRRAAAFGRNPRDILVYSLISVIVGQSEADARAKLAEYRRYVDYESALALFSGWTGIDLSKYTLDDPFPIVHRDNAITSVVDNIARAERALTVREVIEQTTIGGRGPLAIGSPTQVADELQSWIAETDIDGFNLTYAVTPEGYADFIDLVVPELQARGVYRTAYTSGTLREKAFGEGARLPARHPAARFRDPDTLQPPRPAQAVA